LEYGSIGLSGFPMLGTFPTFFPMLGKKGVYFFLGLENGCSKKPSKKGFGFPEESSFSC
jgi:hypothetical protein